MNRRTFLVAVMAAIPIVRSTATTGSLTAHQSIEQQMVEVSSPVDWAWSRRVFGDSRIVIKLGDTDAWKHNQLQGEMVTFSGPGRWRINPRYAI